MWQVCIYKYSRPEVQAGQSDIIEIMEIFVDMITIFICTSVGSMNNVFVDYTGKCCLLMSTFWYIDILSELSDLIMCGVHINSVYKYYYE